EQVPEPRLGRHLHVIAGGGDDPLVLLEIAVEHHLSGLGALYPEVLRNFPAAEHRVDLRPNVIGDPVHVLNSDCPPQIWVFYSAAARRAARTPEARLITSVS